MDNQDRYYLSCRVGREWYGIDLIYVSKVLHLVALTEIPSAPPDVLGLLALQNRVVPVVDLRRRFRVADTSLKVDTPIVVIDMPQGMLGVVVDDADDVEFVESGQITAYEGDDLPFVSGVAKQPGRLLLLLDTAQLVTQRFHSLAENTPVHQSEM